jgi:hypothetical protein
VGLPLEAILQDIRKAIEAKLYYLALSVTLSVPDICSTLELTWKPKDRIKDVGPRYRKWCGRYLIPQYGVFTAEDCWALRGGVLHNGRLFGHPSEQYDRLVFTLPGRNMYDECVSRDNAGIPGSALQLDLVTFCERMTIAARRFLAETATNPVVQQNLNNLVRYRPNGIAPHFMGTPVIA